MVEDHRAKSLAVLTEWLKGIEEDAADPEELRRNLARTGMDPYRHIETCKTLWNGMMELHNRVFGFSEEESKHFRTRYDALPRFDDKTS